MSAVDDKTNNQDFLQAIKQKYVTNKSTQRNSPSRYASRTNNTTAGLRNDYQTNTQRQSVSPLQQKSMNYGEMYQSTLKNKVMDSMREYQSVKTNSNGYDRAYQQRALNRQSVQLTNVKDEKYSVYPTKENLKENQGKATTSSPIKHFYEDSSKKEVLQQRKAELQQAQIQRANQAKLEREKTANAITNVESLLDTIRKALVDRSRK